MQGWRRGCLPGGRQAPMGNEGHVMKPSVKGLPGAVYSPDGWFFSGPWVMAGGGLHQLCRSWDGEDVARHGAVVTGRRGRSLGEQRSVSWEGDGWRCTGRTSGLGGQTGLECYTSGGIWPLDICSSSSSSSTSSSPTATGTCMQHTAHTAAAKRHSHRSPAISRPSSNLGALLSLALSDRVPGNASAPASPPATRAVRLQPSTSCRQPRRGSPPRQAPLCAIPRAKQPPQQAPPAVPPLPTQTPPTASREPDRSDLPSTALPSLRARPSESPAPPLHSA